MKKVPIYSGHIFDFIKNGSQMVHDLSFIKRQWVRLFGVNTTMMDTNAYGDKVVVITSYIYRGKIYIFNYKWLEVKDLYNL